MTQSNLEKYYYRAMNNSILWAFPDETSGQYSLLNWTQHSRLMRLQTHRNTRGLI